MGSGDRVAEGVATGNFYISRCSVHPSGEL